MTLWTGSNDLLHLPFINEIFVLPLCYFCDSTWQTDEQARTWVNRSTYRYEIWKPICGFVGTCGWPEPGLIGNVDLQITRDFTILDLNASYLFLFFISLNVRWHILCPFIFICNNHCLADPSILTENYSSKWNFRSSASAD